MVFLDGPLRGWAHDVETPPSEYRYRITHAEFEMRPHPVSELVYAFVRRDNHAAFYTLSRTDFVVDEE